MQNTGHGLHHLHKRKKQADQLRRQGTRLEARSLEPYPHSDPLKRFIDYFIYFIAAIGPLMTIPQIVQVFSQKSAAGISLWAWGTYVFTAAFWLIYGLVHKDKPLIYSSIAWIVANGLVVVGAIIYW